LIFRNVWFCYELAERLAPFNVSVNCLAPGLVPTTGLFDASSFYIRILMRWILYYFPFSRTEAQGGETIVHVATKDVGTSNYFEDNKKVESSEESNDKQLAKKLWDLSTEWTK
jgi:NAD(P)-dependent dehydrogenase (short-subunit alcohol dehydrogenase family)